MNDHSYPRFTTGQLIVLALALALPLSSQGGALDLTTVPMATSSNTTVLPNVMYILDDSGSMGWTYLPDWAGTLPTNVTISVYATLADNGLFNGVYYNDAIVYTPPVMFNPDGSLNTTQYPSMTGLSTVTGAGSGTKPNWTNVPIDGYGVIQSLPHTSNLTSSASFYTFIPGEYCTTENLTTCVTQSAPSTTYPFPGALRWCSSAALTTCQRSNDGSTYIYVRFAGQVISTGTSATSATTIKNETGSNTLTSITVNGQNILSSSFTYSGTSESTFAGDIVTYINNCTSAITGSCQVAGYSAVKSGSGSTYTVTITAPLSLGNFTATPVYTKSGTGSITITPAAFSGGSAAVSVPGSNTLTTISTANSSYPYSYSTTKNPARTDCAGPTTCTYTEEMTNYANWYAYYQTRIQSTKTSVSKAFEALSNNFRVGFTTISNTGATDNPTFLHIDTFQTTQKYNWYTTLFSINAANSTPLRIALSKVGKIYADKVSGETDPVQYSCQQNFAIMSTDGYWNDTTNPTGLTGAAIGDQDGGSTPRPMYEGPTASSNTLADVAAYYYNTDLRTSALSNCTGALGAGVDVCANNVFTSDTDNNDQQHMTTFTIGLGVDALLNYSSDYYNIKKDAPPIYYPPPTTGSMDYYNLINGYGSPTVNWPVPKSNTISTVDDLWHAAVNGHGIYFSAKNPDLIYSAFEQALTTIQSRVGAGAAAATSTLNPVAGNNFAYVASYETVQWTGNLEARTINPASGAVSASDTWCAESVNPSLGVTACTGTMEAMVGTTSDSRNIYMNVGGSLQPFTYTNLSTAGDSGYFSSSYLSSRLSQWLTMSAANQSLAAGANLVNYLRGQYGYDNRSSNTTQLYRNRLAVLGDDTESKPAFIAAPTFSYTDPGYSTFVTANASREGVVYLGTNDGMLHAFNANNGSELWAYVPTAVIPNLWKLADVNYGTEHTNYVNGSPVISDICVANCTNASSAVWKTILVCGLDGGGHSYFALDITVPTAPVLLWEFSASNDSDLGYTFGEPVVTKLTNGTWVVLLTSGYDNGTLSGDGVTANAIPGSGGGFLYVLNAASGAQISKLGTGVGTAANPSGLTKIAAWATNTQVDNTATYVYGGDLLGNLWRFNINSAASAGTNPFLFATLFADTAGTLSQPITTRPELGTVNGDRVVFVGTGEYLQNSDLTNTETQSLYAISDNNASATLVNPRTTLVQQTLTESGANRTASNNAVNFTTGRGWYVNFPDSGERVNVDPQLVSGTLLVPTTVPSSTVCSPGGTSWFNFFNYQTGGAVNTVTNLVSNQTNAPIVGMNVYFINGLPVVATVTADNPTPVLDSNPTFLQQSAGFQQKKIMWRELIQ